MRLNKASRLGQELDSVAGVLRDERVERQDLSFPATPNKARRGESYIAHLSNVTTSHPSCAFVSLSSSNASKTKLV